MSRLTECNQCKKQVYGIPQRNWVIAGAPGDKGEPLTWENGRAFCSFACIAAWGLAGVERERQEEASRDKEQREADEWRQRDDEQRRKEREQELQARAARDAILSQGTIREAMDG